MGREATLNTILALTAGAVLAVLMGRNSELARHSSPMLASLAAHGIGGIASLALIGLLKARHSHTARAPRPTQRWPLWSYLGGVPGSMTVVLAAVTVNSPLGLAGTLALLLVGQMLFGLAVDRFGLFRLPRRMPGLRDIAALTLVLCGALLVIAGRA